MPALSAETLKKMEEAAAGDADFRFSVIVSLEGDATVEDLERAGLTVANRFPSIHAAAGSATLATLRGIAAMRGVALIELDEPGVHAI